MSCSFNDQNEPSIREFDALLIRWSINGLPFFSKELELFIFESNYSPQEIEGHIQNNPSLWSNINALVVVEVARYSGRFSSKGVDEIFLSSHLK